jgi:hypothetical protein
MYAVRDPHVEITERNELRGNAFIGRFEHDKSDGTAKDVTVGCRADLSHGHTIETKHFPTMKQRSAIVQNHLSQSFVESAPGLSQLLLSQNMRLSYERF